MDDGRPFQEHAADGPETRLAVHLAVMVASCGIACVAALMPSLAHRVGLDLPELLGTALALLAGTGAGCVFGVCARVLQGAVRAGGRELEASGPPPWRPGMAATSGLAGAGGVLVTTLLLAVGFEPPLAAALVVAPMAVAVVVAWPYVLEAPARGR